MQLSAALVAAFLAATATALPVAGDDGATNAPARRYRPMPIIYHRPSDRRSPGMHIIDKIPVPEKRDGEDAGNEGDDEEASVERRYRPMPIIYHRPSDRRGEPATEKSAIANSFWGMPIIYHRPSDRRRAEADAAAVVPEEKSAGSAIAKAFWGMPIINHIPYPGRRRGAE